MEKHEVVIRKYCQINKMGKVESVYFAEILFVLFYMKSTVFSGRILTLDLILNSAYKDSFLGQWTRGGLFIQKFLSSKTLG